MDVVEEQKDETPEGRKKRFRDKWRSIIDEDVEQMEEDSA
jgi:hypothetical protein